jgi:hypothetical protein
MIHRLTASLAAAIAILPAAAIAAPTLQSGVYDNTLILAVGPGGAVSGYFDMTQGQQFSCIFYLRGHLAGNGAIIDSYFPGDPKGDHVAGRLEASAGGKVRAVLKSEHGGCGNVWHFADADNPADFVLQTAQPWTSIRVVKAAKAYFSPAPGASHGRAYVVNGDGVGVRTVQNGWAQVDFPGETRTSSGWLSEADLYPPAP